jgi:type IV pilus assembly protein PilY1
LGGIVLTPTFIPNPDVCGVGGNTNYYALYFETGTAYKEHIFSAPSLNSVSYEGQQLEIVESKLAGTHVGTPPPTSGIHVGRQDGAKAFVQLSTGEILEVEFDTALPIRSDIINWRLGE